MLDLPVIGPKLHAIRRVRHHRIDLAQRRQNLHAVAEIQLTLPDHLDTLGRRAAFREQLGPVRGDGDVEGLKSIAAGVVFVRHSPSLSAGLPKLSDITITKDKALRLATVLKTRYANQVLSIYPEALNLHPHCQGVLLSLVFNRGPGLKDKKGQLTRKHMRQIKDAFKNNEIDKIPDIFRDMSKLWNKTGKNGNRGRNT